MPQLQRNGPNAGFIPSKRQLVPTRRPVTQGVQRDNATTVTGPSFNTQPVAQQQIANQTRGPVAAPQVNFQGQQSAVAQPVPISGQPSALQDQLTNTLMNRVRDNQGVNLGRVGTEFEEQLFGRLGGGGAPDAIRQAQEAEFRADTARREAQLVEDLQRFGVLGDGVSAGAVSDVLGEFQGQRSRGLLDIGAEAQRRRDQDLDRAAQFANFQAQLGFQNQDNRRADLAQALAGNEAFEGRNLQRQQFNTQAGLQGQQLAEQARQFDSALGFDQAARNADLELATGQAVGNIGGQDTLAAQGLDQANNQFSAALDQDRLFGNQQLGLQGDALREQQAGRLQNLSQFNVGLDQDRQKFLADLGLRADTLGEQGRQFDAGLGQQESQFGRSLGQQQGQFEASLGEQQAGRLQQNDQFQAQDRLANLAQQLQAQQFEQSLGLDRERLGQQDEQFQRQADQQNLQFFESLGLDRDRLARQDEQFGRSLDQQNDQFQAQDRLANLEQQLRAQQFQDQLRQQESQFGRGLGLDRQRLFETRRQFNEGLDEQERQFDLNRALQEGQLTGRFDGRDTLQRDQFLRSLGLDQARLNQQGSQFDQSFGLQERLADEGSEERRIAQILAANEAGISGFADGAVDISQLLREQLGLAPAQTLATDPQTIDEASLRQPRTDVITTPVDVQRPEGFAGDVAGTVRVSGTDEAIQRGIQEALGNQSTQRPPIPSNVAQGVASGMVEKLDNGGSWVYRHKVSGKVLHEEPK